VEAVVGEQRWGVAGRAPGLAHEQRQALLLLLPVVTRWHEALRAAGGNSMWIDLPKMNIVGNSHMLMMDTNSDQVAALIQDWMRDQHLMK
jgi:hypothetical protein